MRDHPRLRGEQQYDGKPHRIKLGSPPLARGTVSRSAYCSPFRGITPACAGNSYPLLRVLQGHGDHPRLRGEQRMLGGRDPQQLGSPPLARGTDVSASVPSAYNGITPACAGNSL